MQRHLLKFGGVFVHDLELWKTVFEMIAALAALGASLTALYFIRRDVNERKKERDGE